MTNIYYRLSWVPVVLCLLLTTLWLWNASVTLSEKALFAMAYVLSLFAAIAVQKNTRDSVGGVGEDVAG